MLPVFELFGIFKATILKSALIEFGDKLKGFTAQAQHWVIPKDMDIEDLRSLVK